MNLRAQIAQSIKGDVPVVVRRHPANYGSTSRNRDEIVRQSAPILNPKRLLYFYAEPSLRTVIVRQSSPTAARQTQVTPSAGSNPAQVSLPSAGVQVWK